MPDTNGRHAPDQDGDGAAPAPDPLAEAEAIRNLLGEAQTRLGRLIGSLKQFRKQSRAVRAAVLSLRELPPLTP
jgi:hypothetical protein